MAHKDSFVTTNVPLSQVKEVCPFEKLSHIELCPDYISSWMILQTLGFLLSYSLLASRHSKSFSVPQEIELELPATSQI